MRRQTVVLAVVMLLVLVGLGGVFLSVEEPVADDASGVAEVEVEAVPTDPVPPPVPGQPTYAPNSPEARRLAIANRREAAREEWPRGSAIHPDDRPEGARGDWAEVRAEQASLLQEEQVAAAADWAAQQGLSEVDQDAVVSAIDGLHNELLTLRAQVEAGQRSPAELREQTARLREQTRATLVEVVGETETARLQKFLSTKSVGGGF